MDDTQTTTCPCCGQTVKGHQLLFNADMNTIARGNAVVKFTQREFDFAQLLVKKFPATATKEAIYDKVFMHANGDGPDMKIVDVILCHIRPRMAELGMLVETVWGKGYRLIEGDPMDAETLKDASVRMREKGTQHRWNAEHDKTLRDLIGRKLNMQQIATHMRMPYMTVERAMKRLSTA
jgi:DNA-binding winged helix-turn-helix (wHTH) protein